MWVIYISPPEYDYLGFSLFLELFQYKVRNGKLFVKQNLKRISN